MKNDLKNQIPLIVTGAIIVIAVLFVYLWMSGIILKGRVTTDSSMVNTTPESNRTNYDLQFFPPEIREDILNHAKKYSVNVSYWGFDPLNKEINLLDTGTLNESVLKELQQVKIGPYNIHVLNNTEILRSQDDVYYQVSQLRKNPQYQINQISMVPYSLNPPTRSSVELWCTDYTPENKKLNYAVIKGWVIVVIVPVPIPKDTWTPNLVYRS